MGGPRSYKWLNTVPIPKIWEQMHLAYRYGANRLWIVNVGDLKPMELPIQFFLDYAWEPERWPAEKLADFGRTWAEREFGKEHASEVADIVAKYTKYNGRRKPEMLDPRTYSLVDYREAETVVADFARLVRRAEQVDAALPRAARDAFFQLVLHPVKASAVLNDLYVTVGRNRLHAVQGRTSTNDLAERARELFREDERLSREYNETLAGGKWRHMMDQTHIGYTYWNQPVRNAMPAVQEVQAPEPGELGVTIEGSEASWPGVPGQPVLPALSVYDRRPRYVEVFNRGREPFSFTVAAGDPWLQVDVTEGTVERDRRIWVGARWDEVPVAAAPGSIVIAGPKGAKVVVKVPVLAELHGGGLALGPYPYLHAGDTIEKRHAVARFLRERGYRAAEVTLSFDDYAYNDPYVRCLAKNDLAAIEWMKQSYLSRAEETLSAGRQAARLVYRRDIAHVLLLHIGGFGAVMLDRLLDLLEQRAVQLVTLEEAQSDPAYAVDPADPPSASGRAPLQQLLDAQRISTGKASDDALARLAGLCR